MYINAHADLLEGFDVFDSLDVILFHTNIPYNLDLAVILFSRIFILILPNVASAIDESRDRKSVV